LSRGCKPKAESVRYRTTRSADTVTDSKLCKRPLHQHLRNALARDIVRKPYDTGRVHALSVQLPPEPVVVYGDPSRLVQVFANLIQNAAKFMPPHGSLRITVESEDGMALVRVRDNGPGIEAHMLQSIFAAFTQVDSAPTSANDGMGIGLRHVKSIVELHGGDVTARSDGLGRGSEFTVRLPTLPSRSICWPCRAGRVL
jgi:signal transduction histidine kinase